MHGISRAQPQCGRSLTISEYPPSKPQRDWPLCCLLPRGPLAPPSGTLPRLCPGLRRGRHPAMSWAPSPAAKHSSEAQAFLTNNRAQSPETPPTFHRLRSQVQLIDDEAACVRVSPCDWLQMKRGSLAFNYEPFVFRYSST